MENLHLKSHTNEELEDLIKYLLQFNFTIICRPESKNGEADGLSRNPVLASDFGQNISDILAIINLLLSIEEIKTAQIDLPYTNKNSISDDIIIRSVKGLNKIILNKEFGEYIIEKVHKKYGHIGPK